MWLAEQWSDYTFRTVTLATALFGIGCALIGSCTFLQRQSLLGDVISHATLPGIICALLYVGTKQPLMLLCGGMISAAIGVFCMQLIVAKTTVKKDAALGIILSVFFGLGLVLLTYMQRVPEAQHSLVVKYIFGNAGTVMTGDLYLIGAVTLAISIILFLFAKEWSLMLFDAEQASLMGYPVRRMRFVLTLLTIACIITGLQLVGVVLMSSFLIAPAAAARQWTNNFRTMMLLAACIGCFSAVVGTMISALFDDLATGPVIVIIASGCVAVSLAHAYLGRKRISLP
jgi:manganese/zinc/iron transport system permease protein